MDILVGVERRKVGNRGVYFDEELMMYDALKLKESNYKRCLILLLVSNGIFMHNGKSLRKQSRLGLECILRKNKIEIPARYLSKRPKPKNKKNRNKNKAKKRKQNYIDYINSSEWRDFRKMIIDERGSFCERCDGEFESVHIHHIHYKNFKKELRGDVLVLCESCHNLMHKHLQSPPYTIEKLNKLL